MRNTMHFYGSRAANFDAQRARAIRNDFRRQDAAAVDLTHPCWIAFCAIESNAARAAWICNGVASGNEFAISLFHAVCRYRDLTFRQGEAVDRNVARLLEAQGAPQNGVSAQAALDTAALFAAFQHAREARLRRAKLVVGDLTVMPASDHGRNAGGLYVTMGETYVGKIVGAVFTFAREWLAENGVRRQLVLDQLGALCSDPTRAAEVHGRLTGSCSCCGLTLTNPESIERGIGPICAGKWGF